jgi:hypothetical protein
MELEKNYKIIDANAIAEIYKKPHMEDEEYTNFKYYSDNEYPKKLIDERRPNEAQMVKEYREKTYQPVFQEVFDRVLASLNKIHRADGFFIKYPDQKEFTQIADGEKLPEYLETDFKGKQSIMNYTFSTLLKQYLIDANGICLIWGYQPITEEGNEDNTNYIEPHPYIINTDKIIYFSEGESFVYRGEHSRELYSVDKIQWAKWVMDKRGVWRIEKSIPNLSGEACFFRLGGLVESTEDLGTEYQSRLKAMLPWLNVATVEFSDLQAEIVMHIHSQQWIYQSEECGTCNGNGYLMKDQQKVPCTNSSCKGGYVSFSPYEPLRIRPAKVNMGETAAPTPPMGYVQKDTEIAKLQDARIDRHRNRALSAINMQFLEVIPAAVSGVSKAYDRDETNNTFYAIAKDLGRIIEFSAYYVAVWRYNQIYSNDIIKMMCPIVIVPNTFDILSSDFLIQEIKAAKDSGLNDSVLSEMEIEFIKKRFPNDPTLQNIKIDAMNLDPLSGLSAEEKALIISNKGASKQDYIISTYIQDFIAKAYQENKDFQSKTIDQKSKVLYDYANQKLKDINTKEILASKIFGLDTLTVNDSGKGPADLKYTVGGLTGIIEIVKAVSSGVYDLEAAINMVMDRFGLTYEQAKAQLGTPAIISSEAELDKVTKLT